jgi:hypothetical protein
MCGIPCGNPVAKIVTTNKDSHQKKKFGEMRSVGSPPEARGAQEGVTWGVA